MKEKDAGIFTSWSKALYEAITLLMEKRLRTGLPSRRILLLPFTVSSPANPRLKTFNYWKAVFYGPYQKTALTNYLINTTN
jgi:hypothetical protein